MRVIKIPSDLNVLDLIITEDVLKYINFVPELATDFTLLHSCGTFQVVY